MIEATFTQIPDAFRLSFAAFDARLIQAIKITQLRLGKSPDDLDEESLRKLEGEDDVRPYTGLLI